MTFSSLRVFIFVPLILLTGSLFSLGPIAVQAQNVFVVDVTGDGSDGAVGDGTCATSGADCTLRAAIEEANATSNVDSSTPDQIEFSVSTSNVISPGSPLPVVSDPVVIDGSTAPSGGQPRLRIDGGGVSSGDGLVVQSGRSTVRGLSFVRFPGSGLQLTGGGGNVIQNCRIGDFLSQGSPAGYGNGGDGIVITGGSTRNIIGDADDAGARNIIGGNGGSGIRIDGGSPGATNNRIVGNYIGLATDGATDLGNTDHGVLLENQTRSNVIGSGQSGSLVNVISGNGKSGIRIIGTFGNAASTNTSGNAVLNNHIGLTAAGDAAVSNAEHGIHVDGATGTRIGSTVVSGNVISGNGGNGIWIYGTDVSVRGNWIGTDATGLSAIGNGASEAGVILVGATTGVTIGGTVSAYRNVISGNGQGIVLNSASNNTIQGNYVGVDRTGDGPLGNMFNGVRIGGASQNNSIGGTDSGAGNRIAENGSSGIRLTGTNATENALRGNTFFRNGGLGIDLSGGTEDADGRTANDAGDGDDGMNRLQNVPVIHDAEYNPFADQVSVTYSVPSTPGLSGSGASTYDLTIDFYKGDSDREEGESLLASTVYTASTYNNGPNTFYGFTPPSGEGVDKNTYIVATATDADGNTSEFSLSVSLGARRFVVNDEGDDGDESVGDGTCGTVGGVCTMRAAIEEANATSNGSEPDRIEFDLSGTPPYVIQPATELPRISDPVVIDGTSEPEYSDRPVVVISGVNASGSLNGENGLYIEAGGSTVRGLAVVDFNRNGIVLVGNDGNAVEANYIGLRADGTTGAGNDRSGIFIGSNGNTIGGASDNLRNVIAAQSENGFDITGTGNVVENNYVGTDAAGTADVGNFRGVRLRGDNNTIRDNVISGNQVGVTITSNGSAVLGNHIGVDTNGDPLPNDGRGVFLTAGAANNVLGGRSSGEGNTIAHNAKGIVLFSGAGLGNAIRGNATFDNDFLGIDLGDDNVTANDAGDGDTGPNRLQNHPVLQAAGYDGSSGKVTVTYLVDTDPANATYPLSVDFYRADAGEEEGAAYLGTDSYPSSAYDGCGSPPCTKTISFSPQDAVSESDILVAAVVDADGNTSEFAANPQPLPVELAGFAAERADTQVRLAWRTASETNNAGFHVERLGPGGWSALGFVDGRGTVDSPQSYRFVDETLPFTADSLSYRLRQVDLDGTATLSQEVMVGVGAPERLALLAPFPNPARSVATLRFVLPNAMDVEMAVYNVLGQRVATLVEGPQPAGRIERRLDTRRLPSGTYFVRMRGGERIKSERFVVLR